MNPEPLGCGLHAQRNSSGLAPRDLGVSQATDDASRANRLPADLGVTYPYHSAE